MIAALPASRELQREVGLAFMAFAAHAGRDFGEPNCQDCELARQAVLRFPGRMIHGAVSGVLWQQAHAMACDEGRPLIERCIAATEALLDGLRRRRPRA